MICSPCSRSSERLVSFSSGRPGSQLFEQIGFIAAADAEALRRRKAQNRRARGFQEGSPKERERSLTDAAQYSGSQKEYESRRQNQPQAQCPA